MSAKTRNAANGSKIRKKFNGLGFIPSLVDGPMGEWCEEVAHDMASRAPKDTGELASAIEVEKPGHFNPFSGENNRSWAIVVNSDHAAAQEYGTSRHDAQPFFRPAIRRGKGRLKAFVKDAYTRGIKKV